MYFISCTDISPESKERIAILHKEIVQKKRQDASWKRFHRIKEKVFDKRNYTKLVLQAYINSLPYLQSYVKLFQSDEPMIHLAHYNQMEVFTNFLSCFIKPEAIDKENNTAGKLTKLDLASNLLPIHEIYLGKVSRKFVNEHKEKSWVRQFLFRLQEGFLKCGQYMQEKLPLSNKLIKSLACLDPELKGTSACRTLMKKLAAFMRHVVPSTADVEKEIKDYQLDPRFPDSDVPIVEYWGCEHVRSHYPGFYKISLACLSIFHGPKIESSFSEMAGILTKKRSRFQISKYNSLQTVRYFLRAKQQTATEIFGRKDVHYDPIDKRICNAIHTAHAKYRRRLAAAKQERLDKLKLLGIPTKQTSKLSRDQIKKIAKREHLLHQERMRKRKASTDGSSQPAKKPRQI